MLETVSINIFTHNHNCWTWYITLLFSCHIDWLMWQVTITIVVISICPKWHHYLHQFYIKNVAHVTNCREAPKFHNRDAGNSYMASIAWLEIFCQSLCLMQNIMCRTIIYCLNSVETKSYWEWGVDVMVLSPSPLSMLVGFRRQNLIVYACC